MLREKFTFYLQRFAVIRNYINNTLVSGTNGHDSIYNEGSNVTIISGTGNDTIYNYDGSKTLINTGAGDDSIRNGLSKNATINAGTGDDTISLSSNSKTNLIVYKNGDGNDLITGFDATSTLSIAGGTYSTQVSGANAIVKVGSGTITLQNVLATIDEIYINEKTISLTKNIKLNDGNDSINNKRKSVTITGGTGDDRIYNGGSNVSINTSAGNNFVSIYGGSDITINGGVGNDRIDNNSAQTSINGGAGNDSIRSWGDLITIAGGKGDDSIYSGASNVLFKYAEGDGNDSIKGMSMTDTLEISSSNGKYSTQVSGEDLIVTVGTGKITLVGAANEPIYIEGKKSSSTSNTWKLNGTTATFGTSKKTLVTVKGVKSTDGLSVSGKVVTVAASALNKSKVTLSGSGYTLKLADDVTKTSTKKAWSLSGTTATYKQTTKAGYKLASDKLSISYKKKASSTLATVYGVKSKSGFTLDDGTITLKTSSLSKKVSVSSSSYGFEFTSDYKKAKVTGSASADTITTAGANMTITGGKGDDIIVSKGKNATITGGKGKDTLTGGSGADIFVYSEGDGNDVITNYDETDRISIKSGKAEVSTSGDDVIFTVGTGKITVKGGNEKNITYVQDGIGQIYSAKSSNVEFNAKGTGATLLSSYSKDSFEQSDYSTYKDILVTIDASAVENSLQITGNKKANKITGTIDDDTIKGGAGVDTILGGAGNDELYGEKGNDSLAGGKGNDSLWGGAGSDTLTGNGGKDIFYYDNGDGDDTITDYSPGVDTVMILSSVNVANPTADSSGNVTFKIGDGQITFQNSADKYIELVDKANNVLKKYNPS